MRVFQEDRLFKMSILEENFGILTNFSIAD